MCVEQLEFCSDGECGGRHRHISFGGLDSRGETLSPTLWLGLAMAASKSLPSYRHCLGLDLLQGEHRL
jgi:hypothetical protein